MRGNKKLMKMMLSISLLSFVMAIFHTVLLANRDSEVHEDPDALRFKRGIKSKIKMYENPSLELIKWFRSVVADEAIVDFDDKPNDSNEPAYLLEDCANDNLYNYSDTLKKNEKGQFEGHGKIIYDRKALCRNLHQIHSIEGFFVKGQPHGKAQIIYRDRTISKVNFVDGVLNGLYVHFWCKFGSCDHFDLESWRKAKHFKRIAVYKKGRPFGIEYQFKAGGGFIVGPKGLTGLDVAYVYPDMETMLVGKFEKGQLTSGLEAKLSDLVISGNGLILPQYEIAGKKSFKYSVSNQTWIGLDPLIRDPLEDKYFMVSNSSVDGAGRGIFLKKAGRKGQIVGFYNGVRMSDIESKVKTEDRKSPYRMDNDWAESSQILNIPKKYQSLDVYNATLGHLINHSPKPNTWFGMIDHPRFGKIRSIILLEEIKTGQELFADYGYIQNYMESESMIRSIYQASKWFMNENDEEFHKDLKFHIKYLKKKVDHLKPYMGMLKTFTNFLK